MEKGLVNSILNILNDIIWLSDIINPRKEIFLVLLITFNDYDGSSIYRTLNRKNIVPIFYYYRDFWCRKILYL